MVSVVTPCFNGETHVGRLIQSVLDQTYPNIEFILVNDGSTDGTDDVVEAYRDDLESKLTKFVYVKQANAGLGGAINAGLRHVTGEYLCWPDADDYLEPTSVEERVRALASRPEAAVVTSDAFIRPEHSTQTVSALISEGFAHTDDEWQFEHLLRGDSIFTPGCHMARVSAFDETHPGRAIYPARRGQNWQILLPMYFRYKRLYLDRPLYNYAVRDASMSKDSTVASRLERAAEHRNIKLQTLATIPMQDSDRRRWEQVINEVYARTVFGLSIGAGDTQLARRSLHMIRYNSPLDPDRLRHWVKLGLLKLQKSARRKGVGSAEDTGGLRSGFDLDAPLSISVLVTTYNGEEFVEEQLLSILQQTVPADQVLICDDGSTDGTVGCIKEFLDLHKPDGWELLQNASNLGPAQNVLSHLSSLFGDLVFLADQDDVWEPDRVKTMVDYMRFLPQVSLGVARSTIVGANGEPLGDESPLRRHRVSEDRYAGAREGMRLDFTHFLGYSSLPLHAMCVRGDVLREIGGAGGFPELSRSLGADWYIGLWSTVLGEGLLVPERLIRRRVHDKNISLGRLRKTTALSSTSEKRILMLKEARQAHRAVVQHPVLGHELDEQQMKELSRMAEFMDARISFAEAPTISKALRLLGSSRLYVANGAPRFRSLRDWAADVMYAYDINWRFRSKSRRG